MPAAATELCEDGHFGLWKSRQKIENVRFIAIC